MKRRYGEPRRIIGNTTPIEQEDLESWLFRWCPDLPETAKEQLRKIKEQEMSEYADSSIEMYELGKKHGYELGKKDAEIEQLEKEIKNLN